MTQLFYLVFYLCLMWFFVALVSWQEFMQMIEFNIGYAILFLFAFVIVTAWLTIDDDDFNKRFEHNRKARFEDEEI